MAFDNTNRGVLFKNEKTSPSHPDYKGSVDVEGVEYFFSGWIKTAGPNAKNPGSKFLSVSIEKKDAKYLKPKAPPSPGFDFDESDVPL